MLLLLTPATAHAPAFSATHPPSLLHACTFRWCWGHLCKGPQPPAEGTTLLAANQTQTATHLLRNCSGWSGVSQAWCSVVAESHDLLIMVAGRQARQEACRGKVLHVTEHSRGGECSAAVCCACSTHVGVPGRTLKLQWSTRMVVKPTHADCTQAPLLHPLAAQPCKLLAFMMQHSSASPNDWVADV